MKKRISVILTIVVVLVLFSGCKFYGNYIVGQGKRPTNFLGSIWASKDPDIWFEVIGEQNGPRELEGYINKNGVLHNINLGINGGGMIFIGPPESGLTGQCEFYTHKLVIEVDKESDTLFNGAYDTITFERQEDREENTEDRLTIAERQGAVCVNRRFFGNTVKGEQAKMFDIVRKISYTESRKR